MSIRIRMVSDVCILDVSGRLSIGQQTAEIRQIIKELTEAQCRNLLINLSKVTFVDSSGVGALVSAYTTASGEGALLKLLHLTKRVRHLLSITKLLTVFEVFDDEEQAVASFQDAAPQIEESGTLDPEKDS